MKNRFINKGEDHQHFSLRKLTIGVASVLLGTTFMVFGSQTAHAAEQPTTTNNNVTQKGTENELQKSNEVTLSSNKNVATNNTKNVINDVNQPTTASKAAIADAKQSTSTVKSTVVDTKTAVTTKDSNAVNTQQTSKNVVTQNSSTKFLTPQQANVPQQEIDEIISAFDLNRPDMSTADLAKLGLQPGEYYSTATWDTTEKIKYHVKYSYVVDIDGQKINIGTSLPLFHNANGTADQIFVPTFPEIIGIMNKYHMSGLPGIRLYAQNMPIIMAGTTYVHQGISLSSQEAKEVMEHSNKAIDLSNATAYNWDGSEGYEVNTNTPGTYNGMIDVTFGSGITSVGVKVIVVGPTVNKTVTVNQGDPAPKAADQVTNKDEIAQDIPGNTTYSWEKTPDTSVPGSYPAVIITTWPDGETTKSDITVIVKATTEDITTGDGTTMDVTRDIYTKLGDAQPTKVDTETVTLHRTGVKDLATGKITWNAWQAQEMPAYSAPAEKNYTVTNPDAGAAVEADGSQAKLADVVFNYTANHQTITTGEGTTMEVSRDIYTKLGDAQAKKIDTQTVTLHRTGDKNMATGQITWSAWTDATIPAYSAPSISGYTIINPNAGASVTVDGSQSRAADVVFNYTAQEHKQVINYVDINDSSDIVKTSSLEGKTDTNVAFTPEAPAGWVIVPGQNIPSQIYFGTTDNAPITILVDHGHDINAKGDSKTITRTVQYIDPNTGATVLIKDQKVTITRSTDKDLVTGDITYGPWTTGVFNRVSAPSFPGYIVVGQPYASGMVVTNATPDSTVTFKYTAQWHNQAINYVDKDTNSIVYTDNVGGQTNSTVIYDAVVPGGYELAPGQASQLTVKFGTTDPTTPLVIYVVGQVVLVTEGTTKMVTRNIYTQIEGQAKQYYGVQNVTLTRTAERNIITGKITYGDWSTATIANYPAPEMSGYKVTNPNAGASVMVGGPQDVAPQDVAPQDVIFNYVPAHETITTGDGTEMTVTRDIYTELGDAQPTKVDIETVTLHRTGDKDLATGKVTWGAWQAQEMPAYPAPVEKNYTVTNPDAGAAVEADGSQAKLDNVVFNYKANTEQVTTGQGTEMSVKRDVYTQLEGQDKKLYKTDTVTLHRTGVKNLATGEITWGAWNTDTMDAVTAPEITNYTVTNPDAAQMTITSASKDSQVVFNYKANHETISTGKDTEKTVTRDIYIKLGDGQEQKVDTQSVTLHRTGDKNMATGEITWGAWNTDTMPAYTAPVEKNYTVTNPDAAAQMTITSSSQNSKVVFIYTANTEQVTTGQGTEMSVKRDIYTQLEGQDKKLYKTETVTLHRTGVKNLATGEITWNAWNTDTMPAVTAPEITNYTVTNPDAAPQMTITSSSQNSQVVFNYKANHETITTGKDAEKTITRDIYIKLGDGQEQKVDSQTVTLHRTGDKNLATGEITWGAWNTDTMPAYTAPVEKNYTVTNPDAAPQVTITSSSQNSKVVFNYTANHQAITTGDGTTMVIKRDIYVQLGDATPTKYDTEQVTLHRTGDKNLATGEITWSAWSTDTMPAYTAPVEQDYTVTNPDAAPALNITSSSKDSQVTFKYTANTENVTTGDGTEMTVTRDIYTQIEGQAKKLVKTEEVTLHRTGVKNLVTGEITWGAWNTDTMPAVTAPTIAGYAVTNPTAGNAVAVNGSQAKLTDVVFDYAPNIQSVNVKYVEEGTNNVISTSHVTGKTGETVTFDPNSGVPAGWSIVKGQNLPSSFTFTANPLSDVTIYIHHDENNQYHVSVPQGEKVITHVGATANVPSLSASNIQLSWTKDGNTVSAPAGVKVEWETVPATTNIGDETGTLKVTFSDGTSTTVTIPVTVQGATAINGQKANQGDPVPPAKNSVDTTTVDHFGVSSVTWATAPDMSVAGANVPAVAKVNYSDGTYQDVPVTLDIIEVINGNDHHDDAKLYLESVSVSYYGYTNSRYMDTETITSCVRSEHIDLALPENDPNRITYTDWVIQTITKLVPADEVN